MKIDTNVLHTYTKLIPPIKWQGKSSGILLLIFSLIAIYFLALNTMTSLAFDTKASDEYSIRVIGHQFWWEGHYPDHQIITANEIHIPVNQRVKVELNTADVIHSFWIPEPHGKLDLIPGRTNTFWLEPPRPHRLAECSSRRCE